MANRIKIFPFLATSRVTYFETGSEDKKFYSVSTNIGAANRISISISEFVCQKDCPVQKFIRKATLLRYDGKTREVFDEGLNMIDEILKSGSQLILPGTREAFLNAIGLILYRENRFAYETLFTAEKDENSYGTTSDDIFICDIAYEDNYSFNAYQVLMLIRNFVSLDGNSLEKLIKGVGLKFLKRNLIREKIQFADNSKLNRSLGIPKELVLKLSHGYTTCLESFQTISSILDGNSAIYLVNFLDKWYTRKEDSDSVMAMKSRIVNNIAKILTHRKTAMPTLITYLVRQGYYDAQKATDLISLFVLNSITQEAVDVFEMYKSVFGIEMADLPTDLKYEHDVLANNIETLENRTFNRENFTKFAAAYGNELHYEEKDLLIRAPSTPEEVVFEGSYLRHCVAKYVKNIANGTAKVLFCRKTSAPDTPFVTIEYDDVYGIVQLKTFCDVDVMDKDVLQFVHRYEDELQKRKDAKKAK